jgi:hypothetical protein
MEVVEGVRGGVVMPICMLLGLGDIEFDKGDGILYLQI